MNNRMGTFNQWKDKVLFWCITGLVAGGVSWSGWVTLAIFERPTYAQTKADIKELAPYVEDRQMILAKIASMEESKQQFSQVIERNTEAINALRVEIAKLQR